MVMQAPFLALGRLSHDDLIRYDARDDDDGNGACRLRAGSGMPAQIPILPSAHGHAIFGLARKHAD